MNTEKRLENEFKELIKEISDEVVKNTVISQIKLLQKNISNNSTEIEALTDQLKKETKRITNVRKNIQKDIIINVEKSKQEVIKSKKGLSRPFDNIFNSSLIVSNSSTTGNNNLDFSY